MIGLMLCLQLSIANQDSATGFADALMREGDYFRAIGEYKRVHYNSSSDSVKNYCLLQIAKSYRKSFKYESANRFALDLLDKEDLSPALRQQANLNLGLSYFESHLPQLSVAYFREAVTKDTTAFPLLCMGLAELEMQNLDGASALFKNAARFSQDGEMRGSILGFEKDIVDFKTHPKKSPFLATSLSLVVPGSGQFYSGHAYDGMQAFLFTTSFAFATYAIYKYEHAFKEHLALTYVGISITAIFHAANVIGANRTAHYRNWKKQQDFAKAVHEAVMVYEP